jgi:proteasome lid subunit RPN8/RPN11
MITQRVARIQLTPPQRRQLYRIRRRAWPYEGCALLLGTYHPHGLIARVAHIAETENIAKSPASFQIDPEQQFDILTKAAEQGLEHVGIYHSHPAPPKPSGSDLEFMKYNPCTWVIDGKKRLRNRMKAYQLWQGFLISVDIEIVSE